MKVVRVSRSYLILSKELAHKRGQGKTFDCMSFYILSQILLKINIKRSYNENYIKFR